MEMAREASTEALGRGHRASQGGDELLGLEDGGRQMEPGIRSRVLLHPEWKNREHLFLDPLLGLFGGLLQMGRALGQDLHEGEALSFDLQLHRLLDGFLGPHALLRVEQRHALHVDRPVELGDQLGHLHRAPHQTRAALRARRRLLSHERGGSQLAAGHSVDRVVDENHRERDTQLSRGHDLREADGSEIAVPLVADHDGVGVGDLVPQSHRRGASVSGLRVSDVEVVVEEDRAADG